MAKIDLRKSNSKNLPEVIHDSDFGKLDSPLRFYDNIGVVDKELKLLEKIPVSKRITAELDKIKFLTEVKSRYSNSNPNEGLVSVKAKGLSDAESEFRKLGYDMQNDFCELTSSFEGNFEVYTGTLKGYPKRNKSKGAKSIELNSREKVSEEDLKKAKESGVVQIKPNGSWGIISIENGEWWLPDYESEESAKAALKAYHAGRFGNSVLKSMWNEAMELCKKYSPEATKEELDKIVSFGFGLAAKPQDFIDTLKEKLAERKNNSWHGGTEFPNQGVVYIARPKSDKSGAEVGESKFDKIGFLSSKPDKLSKFLESKGYILMQDSGYLESETRMLATIIMYFDEYPNLTWFNKEMQDSYFAATQDRRGMNSRYFNWEFPDKGCVAIVRPYSDKSGKPAGESLEDHILLYNSPDTKKLESQRLSLQYQSAPISNEQDLLREVTKWLDKFPHLTWIDEDQHKAYAAAMQVCYHRNVNSALGTKDTQFIDKMSRDILDHMDTDYIRICKEIANHIGDEKIPSELDKISKPESYYEALQKSDKISDKLFAALDYAFGIFFGYKIGRKKNSIGESELYAVVIKNPDGTHEVVSIQGKEDEERLDDYIHRDGCKLIKKLDSTKDADKYIDEKKLKRAYDDSRQKNSDVVNLLQRLKIITSGTRYTASYDSEYERIQLLSNGHFFIIDNQDDGYLLMDGDEKLILETKDTTELLDKVKECVRGSRSQNARDAQKEYAFLMLTYNMPDFIKELQAKIPQEELYVGGEGEQDRYGLEKDSHISVLPCLSNNTKLTELIPELPELSTLGTNLVNISVFECDDYDVLKADVVFDSPIKALNEELVKRFKTHSQYEFHPHMTIAYMQKGKAAQYAQELNEPVYVIPNSYAYSFWAKDKMKEIYFS